MKATAIAGVAQAISVAPAATSSVVGTGLAQRRQRSDQAGTDHADREDGAQRLTLDGAGVEDAPPQPDAAPRP